MNTFTVDLSQVAGPVYTGRDRGEALRERYRLDVQEEQAEAVEVLIPQGTYTVSSSFFLGLFGPSVRKCGSVDRFEAKYKFKAPDFLKPVLHKHALSALAHRGLFS